MPFDYKKYREKCSGMTAEELQKEWENYTRQISAGATSTATSILFIPVTGGVSLVGVGLSAPRIHNARKKREIIEAGLKVRGTTHHTRTEDVLAPMALSGVIGGLTLGLLPPGAESVAGVAAGRGLEIAVANTALNATEAVADNARKKSAGEATVLDQNAQDRFGVVATPFTMDASLLIAPPVLQEQPLVGPSAAQSIQTSYQSATQARVDQASTVGDVYARPSPDSNKDQDRNISQSFSSLSIQSPPNPHAQRTPSQPPSTTSDAGALFASIPKSPEIPIPHTDEDDLFDPHTVDEEVLLAMHALTLAMEKHEEQYHRAPNLTPYAQSQDTTLHAGQIETSQALLQNQVLPLGSIQENQVHSDETATPYPSDQQVQEQRPALPPRQGPRSATLPANLYSPQATPYSNQDNQSYQYPPQPVPPYQPQAQYFSPSYQVAEPQQYHPPPPQQRQDSGYGSMYSTPSFSSAYQQTYAPSPISRHSSIPQTYPPPPTSNFYSPQTQAQHGHRSSESSLYPITPPPPYFPPPPGMTTASAPVKENDYFNQNAVPPPPSQQTNSPHSPFNPLLQRGQSLVDEMNKGWHWARANVLPIKTPVDSKRIGEPDYGPPPAVPTEWRGS